MRPSAGADSGDESLATATDSLPDHPSVEARSSLDELERTHLDRMLRGERRFPVFLWVNLGVAASLVIFYTWSGAWSGTRAVLVLLILLGARSHLRQLRSARLLRKLSSSAAQRAEARGHGVVA